MLNGNNPANDPNKKPVRNHSRLKPSRSHYMTAQFGLNTPHYAAKAVEGDQGYSVRVGSDVDTFSLKAPLMSPVKMRKDYFFVPTRAVLPKNAELVITNPLTGDDIVASDVQCGVQRSSLRSFVNSACSRVNSSLQLAGICDYAFESAFHLLRALCDSVYFIEPFASDGSLLSHLGNSCGKNVTYYIDDSGRQLYFDRFLEDLVGLLVSNVRRFTIRAAYIDVTTPNSYPSISTSSNIEVVLDGLAPEAVTGSTWNLRRFLEELRQGLIVYDFSGLLLKADVSDRPFTLRRPSTGTIVGINAVNFTDKFLNASRAVAYQLACVQFYTQDSIDYVYSCNLWHQNLGSLYGLAIGGKPSAAMPSLLYEYNGMALQYDFVSAACMRNVFAIDVADHLDGDSPSELTPYLRSVDEDYSVIYGLIGYINNVFGLTRSLKFRDYFCGAKTAPMAVGNVDVEVTEGSFSVVDVTKNIQMQRFLNQVNRVGRTLKEYVRGIFGTTPAHDPHEVIFLGSTSEVIGAEETENTGSAQLTEAQTVTSKLRKSSSQFAFEGSFAEPGEIIGITAFDVVRPYANSVDREFFHVDRFDDFNPFLQQIGDQAVYGEELIANNPDNFGYQLRYAEYRQSFDYCSGGFREFLPGYAFINDDYAYSRPGFTYPVISPDFIRSRPSEFDRFYVSLTHYSLAGYFHFIIRQDIEVSADRPMEAAPSIL